MKRETIIEKLPSHAGCFTSIQSATIYVRDYKNHDLANKIENRGVVIDANPDPDWASLVLNNKQAETLAIDADCFPENAFPNETAGDHASQCECVIFPADGNEDDWVLFVETKYTYSAEIAQKDKVDYPSKMFSQIKSTVSYFRQIGLLGQDKKVHAIMSYPKLLEPFDSWNFSLTIKDDKTGEELQLTTDKIMENYKIHLRPTNQALIKSAKRIKLGENS